MYLLALSIIIATYLNSPVLENINYNGLDSTETMPQRINWESLGVNLTAKSAIVVDDDSQKILFQKNINQQRSIASITKLMTAIVFLENNPQWEKQMVLIKEDEHDGAWPKIRRGENVSVTNLFNAALVASDNNSISALIRSLELSEEDFVKKMNRKATELGLKNTHYVEPTGLDPANQSTAWELNKILNYALAKSEIQETVTKAKYSFRVSNTGRYVNLDNTDWLVGSYLDVEVGKTGYIPEAGYCLATKVYTPNDRLLTVIILGAEDIDKRFQEVKALVDWVENNYNF